MNFTGLLIGVATFLCIGLFHPLVIKAEYYFGGEKLVGVSAWRTGFSGRLVAGGKSRGVGAAGRGGVFQLLVHFGVVQTKGKGENRLVPQKSQKEIRLKIRRLFVCLFKTS